MSTGGLAPRAKVVALPGPISRDEYADAAAEIEERLTSLPGVVAVYRTGGVSAPGISDIDRIAVLERPTRIERAWAEMAQRTRTIAMHGPFVVDRETFGHHRWFAHLEPLELVTGDPVTAPEPPFPWYFSTLLAVEGIVIGLLKLLKQRSIGRLKARPLLCELHGLRYSLRGAELTPEVAPRAWGLIDDIDELRETWFQQQPPDREAGVRAIAERAPAALLAALEGLRPPDGTPEHAVKPLAMSAPWGNMSIVDADSRAGATAGVRTPRTAALFSRSRRLLELRWRLHSRQLTVPAAALAWLHRPSDPERASLRAERDRIVGRYAAFVDACGGAWSSIGFAGPFLRR